jgi:hypothetical protein
MFGRVHLKSLLIFRFATMFDTADSRKFKSRPGLNQRTHDGASQ